MDGWKEFFALKLRLEQRGVKREPEFKMPARSDRAFEHLLFMFYYDALRQSLYKGMRGKLNFASYDTILKVALHFFALILVFTGYMYLFERPRNYYQSADDVQPQGATDVYEKIFRRSFPHLNITFKRSKRNGTFKLLAIMQGKKSTITYRVLSKKSYNDCYIWLLIRVPKGAELHQAQGILRSFGIRETPAVNFLKCTCFFVYHMTRASNITDRVVAVTQWLDQILHLGLGYNIDVRLTDLFAFIQRMPEVKTNSSATFRDPSRTGTINVDYSSEEGDDVEPEGFAEYADNLNTLLKGVFNSSSIKACLRLLSLVWHMLFVFKDNKIDWDHLGRWEEAMFKNMPEKVLNVGATLLEQISTLATCSYEFYKTGDINVFLRNDTEVTTYMESVEKICAEAKMIPIEPALNAGLPDLEKRIHDLIVRGEILRPKVKMSLRPTFTTALMQLRSTSLEVANIARASSTRAAPFSVLVCGTPKLGKSSIISLIFRQFQLTNPYNEVMQNGLKLHDNGVYTRTLKEEYWSCYMNSYWGILFDDLGQTNPKVQDFALEINEIIQVVNNVMYFPPMAVAGDKGTRYVAPQIVIATTNNRDLNAHHAVRSPGAVLRRFPYVIVPKVRREFATDGTLDNRKIKEGDVDLWTFTIEEVIVTDNGRSVRYSEITRDCSTADMLDWVAKASRTHYEGQSKSDNYLKMVSNSVACSECGCISQFCRCPAAPSVAPRVADADNEIEEESAESGPDSVNSDDDELIQAFSRPRVPARPARRVRFNVAEDVVAEGLATNFVTSFLWRTFKSFVFGYTGTFVVLYSVTQLVMLAMFLERLATRPLAWFVSLCFRNALNCRALDGRSERVRSCRILFWRMIRNCFSFDAADNATLMWACGWVSTATWLRGSVVMIRQRCVANPRMIAAIAAVLVSVSFLVWYYSTAGGWWPKVAAQGDEDSIPKGVVPPPADSNVENTWKLSNKLSYSALLSVQSKTGNTIWFDNIIRDSTAHFAFDAVRTTIIGFNIFGQYWLLPGHYMRGDAIKESRKVTLRRASAIRTGMGNHTQAFEYSSVQFCPDADFALVKLSTPPGVNLLPYISVPAAGTSVAATNLFFREGEIVEVPASPLTFSNGTMAGVAIPADLPPGHVFRKGNYVTNFQTVNGDCGSPCFINQPGNMTLIGTHVAVSNADARSKYVNTLPQKWLLEVFNSDCFCVCQGALDSAGNLEKLNGERIELEEDVHKKCPLRFEGLADNSAIPIGAIKGIALNRLDSRVKENKFASFWRNVGYVCSKVRPVLSSVNVPSWMPKRNFMLNACQHKDMIPESTLQKVADHYFKTLIAKVPEKSIEKCVIIDDDTNLYGAEGNNFISHMRFDTGAGFPYNKPKYEVLDRIDHPQFPDGTCALPASMKKKIEKMEITAARGERINIVFNSSLKDEPISQVKLEAGKIRVFQAICVEGLFLLRKYFLSIIALFQTWNFGSEAAIGMDASGPDWDDLHHHLFVRDWKIFCGDYSNYDQRMGSSIMMHAWKILICLAYRSGNYSFVALKIMRVLAVECCFGIMNFFGDLIMFNGSNPSGHGLTVVINSICNSLYIRIAWQEIFGNLKDFNDDYIRIMTYGDDNIISVHPKYQGLFNQVSVTEALAKYGIVYTDAQKSGAAAKPFCEPHEISFLKRSWVLSPHGFYYAPLEMASIHKMLIIGVDKRAVAEGDRLASVLISSCMEAFHPGESFFNEHMEKVMQCINEYQLKEWVEAKGGLPTFEGMLERRLAKTSRLASVRHLI